MNLEMQPDLKCSGINKQAFQLKNSRRDGLILQVHHTIPTDSGEIHRVRFLHMAFNETGEILAASDHRGNVFIIDLANEKFWLLPNLGSCTVIAFPPTKKNELLFGTVNSSVHLLNIELGTLTGTLDGHTVAPTQATFSSTGQYCITTAAHEALIWDLNSNTLAHQLSLQTNVVVKQVIFMPVSDNILACFQDDAIYIWKFDTFDYIKQIVPDMWESHHVKSIAFTRNGRAMVIGGHSPVLVVFCLDAWSVKKVIKLPEDVSGVRHIEFVPQLFDAGANKILGLLSSHCTLYFLDVESSLFLKNVFEPQKNISKFTVSCNGKYVACILQSGEVNMYRSSQLLEAQSSGEPMLTEEARSVEQVDVEPEKKMATPHRVRDSFKQNLLKVHEQIKETLDLSRLRPILKEFGEYPDSYRPLIWRTILQTPCNKAAYMNLVKREVHPAYLHLEEQYPLENRSVLKNLRRLLSCLAHWSSLFSEVKFLPLFVFPFVKVFQNDPFVCFEAVTTIILNWCQYWFEYFPFPPINVLSMIENVLAEHDSELLEFYYGARVKTDLYAWTLLEVAFSEVLCRSDWLCLWDHVLSNEPSFLLMAVVAYNIIYRRTIMSCRVHDDFEYFFHNQNPVDMKRFISKTYMLCNKTRKEVHPRQYLSAFKPLEKNSYPVFNQYPKFIIDYKAQQMDQLHKEEQNILKEYQTAMKQKAEQEKRMREAIHTEIQEERLKELEQVYQETLRKEKERLAEQQQKVQAVRQTLRARELELLNATRDRLMRQNVRQRHVALNQLLDDIERKRAQEKTEIAAAKEEIQRHYLELLSHQHDLEQKLESTYSAVLPPSVEHHALRQQQEQLASELRKLRTEAASEHHAKQVDITTRLAVMDELLQKVDMKLAKEMAETQHDFQPGQNNIKGLQLERGIKKLEQEVEHLLEQMAELHQQEGTARLHEEAESQADWRTLNTEQEEFVRLKHHDSPLNVVHARWDEQPDKLGQQKGNGKPKQQMRIVPSGAEMSFYIPVRSDEFYRQELGAVKAAMDVRDQIVSESTFR
ncbi:TBC1 domain family member 31 isoform X2 [Cryptotermes secundus]|nr:TBC1 domain family member 31 isoform X2 [Cryptotermes secundus]